MPKSFYQDEEVVFKITFYSDKERTTPVNPADVDLELQKPDGTVVAATVAPVGPTGQYQGTYVLDEYGTWDWRWQTESPRIISQGSIIVVERNVP